MALSAAGEPGASTNGTATVTVTRASSTTTLTVSPGKITTKSKHVRAKVTVTSTGAFAGGKVDLFDGDTKIGTGVLDASGQSRSRYQEAVEGQAHDHGGLRRDRLERHLGGLGGREGQSAKK